ncbi:MAG TPA: F0F1 ATP synthase subunit B [Spirochaetota bacterium]|jgi:F-type H+-transporting ATPase subunit b|nr:F0F1 ATP synthase subunit B [Spirochaetota bacterium]HOA08412.1 F0F1 ATP synthase subunit B [Spirochaetota bacterium]HOF32951.1 F0F1 ATP synthase subunit B [Spirochaetota bacterium]HOH38360.1 F0F1 ATP synthase subunit B [Spirochaetota bacterium]HOR43916.1 F0F1 ATP synthase subunit B [Spirochaetota bacterium]
MVSLNLGLSILIVVSFLITYVIFAKFFWKPILRTIREREEMIQTEIESSKKANIDSEKNIRESEEILLNTKKEAERIMLESKRNAERIRADIIETAKLETQMILQQARDQVEIERGRIIEDLRKDIAGLTILASQKILMRTLTPEENDRIISETVDRLIN